MTYQLATLLRATGSQPASWVSYALCPVRSSLVPLPLRILVSLLA